MADTPPIDTDRILNHLHIERSAPTAAYLSALLMAWSMYIPWESASRIARHKTPAAPYQYARTAAQFFDDALMRGLGGTCFESNTALKALLDSLGYESTFAFCDMNDPAYVHPHCALITTVDGARYIADAGWPLPAAVPLSDTPTRQSVPVYDYHIEPLAADRWRVWRKSGEFEQECFVLKGVPVPPDTFRARLIRDHLDDEGLFLDNVIIHRMIDGRMLRFDQTKGLIERTPGAEDVIPWTDEQAADIPAALHELFQLDIDILRTALS